MKKILITGADGFIGSHLTECLVRNNFDVRAFVFYNSFSSMGWLDYCDKDVKGHYDVRMGDIRDSSFVEKSMLDCDIVLHLASLISIPYSYKSPRSYIETNVIGTLNILEAAKKLNNIKVIHTSTSEVYGTPLTVPIREEDLLQAQSPYSASKIGADQIALAFFKSFQTPVTIIRPFNTYGPRQSTRAVIPTIIMQILSGNEKIEIGSIYPTRDFSYIQDTVNGFLAAVKTDEGLGEVINLGSNFEISIKDTIDTIASLMNTNLEIISDKRRVRPQKSEVDRLLSNNTKALKILNWEPNYKGLNGFKKGLQETIKWFKNNSNLYKNNFSRYEI